MAAETVAEEMAENVTKEVAETEIVTVKLAGGAQEEGTSAFVFLLKFCTFIFFFGKIKHVHQNNFFVGPALDWLVVVKCK